MVVIKRLLLLLVSLFILWTVMPENVQFQLPINGKMKKITLNPPVIDATIAGKQIYKDFRTRLGLDLRGGAHLVFEADTSKLKTADIDDAMQSARDIIERRINSLGAAEPSVQVVQQANARRVTVDLPGIQDSAQAVGLIGQTAQLSFRRQIKIPQELATLSGQIMAFDPNPALLGTDVKKATMGFSTRDGSPEVQLLFDKDGAKKFAKLTEQNIGKPIAIYIDQTLVSAPVVQQAIIGGEAVISGQFTQEQAKSLAIAINSGALPVPIELIEQRQVGPTLGASEIQKSVTAGIVGLGAVMLFMLLYYGRLGFIACLGLLIYGILSFSIFRAIPITLTLSGIAGFILSVGMAVDSNILIFERIKEEKRAGRDHRSAIRLGFGRAIDAIKDANITTIAVALILFNPLNWSFLPQFGLIRGFALTLLIGVSMSLFTGVFVTKKLIELFYSSHRS